MEFVDRQLACSECGQPFIFTAGEQEFYDRKGFKEEPKRCKPCREVRKARRTNQLTEGLPRAERAPDDDSIGNRSSPPARAAQGGRGGRELFDAVCAQCGSATRVPFRPVAGRPVYCRDCFGVRRQA